MVSILYGSLRKEFITFSLVSLTESVKSYFSLSSCYFIWYYICSPVYSRQAKHVTTITTTAATIHPRLKYSQKWSLLSILPSSFKSTFFIFYLILLIGFMFLRIEIRIRNSKFAISLLYMHNIDNNIIN